MADIIHPFRRDLEADYTPKTWTPEHVEKRLADALCCLSSMPSEGPASKAGMWPSYRYSADDLKNQAAFTDLELPPVRNTAPSPLDIALTYEAMSWPMSFLSNNPEIARAVSVWAMGTAFGVSRARIAQRRGVSRHTMKWHARAGFALIAENLTLRGVSVR